MPKYDGISEDYRCKPLICPIFLLTLQSKTTPQMENQDNLTYINNGYGNNPSDNEIIIYQPDSTLSLDVRVENETVWLTQSQMTDLFQTTRNNITMHIRNIFKEGELEEASVCKESLLTAADGKRYKTKYYNLDVIISIGYRVKSLRGTQFRQWANKVLKEYLLRGYSFNQRLLYMESRIDQRLSEHDRRLDELSDKVDFLCVLHCHQKKEWFSMVRYLMLMF